MKSLFYLYFGTGFHLCSPAGEKFQFCAYNGMLCYRLKPPLHHLGTSTWKKRTRKTEKKKKTTIPEFFIQREEGGADDGVLASAPQAVLPAGSLPPWFLNFRLKKHRPPPEAVFAAFGLSAAGSADLSRSSAIRGSEAPPGC